jgi:hypothetical protein
MTPLMKKRTFLLKWAFPYAIVTAVLGWQFHEEMAGTKSDYLIAAVVSATMLAILFFVIRQQSKHEPDQVLDGGTFLRVSYGRQIEDIPISNLQAVETSKLLRLTRSAASPKSVKVWRRDLVLPASGEGVVWRECGRRKFAEKSW